MEDYSLVPEMQFGNFLGNLIPNDIRLARCVPLNGINRSQVFKLKPSEIVLIFLIRNRKHNFPMTEQKQATQVSLRRFCWSERCFCEHFRIADAAFISNGNF